MNKIKENTATIYIKVGILTAPEIGFSLLQGICPESWMLQEPADSVENRQINSTDSKGVSMDLFDSDKTVYRDGIVLQAKAVARGIEINGIVRKEWKFKSPGADASFEVEKVSIGKAFHWERQENQVFRGDINLHLTDDGIVLINRVDLETYLESVISSEMSAHASLELLKAHAVISRSWLLHPIRNAAYHKKTVPVREFVSDEEIIRWYERDDHDGFDVCADDHCQRYQGITRSLNTKACDAVQSTRGELIMYGDEICDARFSKCCGGKTELFSSCWENTDHPYLVSKSDDYCSDTDPEVLRQVLNDYDTETMDFYRWQKIFSNTELAELLERKSGIKFGKIKKLTPLQSGPSGRITLLEIEGELRTIRVGKELEIRKWLSESHLYSSAFQVEYKNMKNDIPGSILLIGSGWGHGVGLCQIGAAVMGARGKNYREILEFYFPGTRIQKL